jgi:peptide/nickel transport system substrate-binding protein
VNLLGLTAVFSLLNATAAPAAEVPPLRTYVGVYLSDVSDLDLKGGRFRADVQVWCKWLGGETPPSLTFENGELDRFDEVSRESEGDWHSVRWRAVGTFRGTFPLQRFPFDTQRLRVRVSLPQDKGELVPDLASSGMSEAFSITGWAYDPYFRAERSDTRVASDFGSVLAEGQPRRLQAVDFVLEMRRPFTTYALKFMLPLSIILAMAFLVFVLPADRFEVRSAMGVTALLSCIAFHFSQADSLPPVAYMVSADKVFVLSYFLIFGSVAESVVASRWAVRTPALAQRLDLGSVIMFPAVAVLVVVWVVRSAIEPPRPPVVEARAPTPASAQKVLRVGVAGMTTLSAGGPLRRVAQRGTLVYDAKGEAQPALVEDVPRLTNDYVRFLPNGAMRVNWRLRPGARFSDGSLVTPDDVAASAKLADPRVTAVAADEFTAGVDFPERELEDVDGIVVYPRKAIAQALLDGGIAVVRKQTATQLPATDGPFALERFEADKAARFTRNRYFAGAAPAFEAIEVKAYPGSKAAAEALLAHEVDFVPVLSAQGVELLTGKAGIRIVQAPADLLYHLLPDLDLPVFQDVRVRRALALALDRRALARILSGADGREANGYRPESADDVVADLPVPGYSLEEARRQLEATGQPLPVAVKLYALAQDEGSTGQQALDLIEKQLEAAGFDVTLEKVKGAASDLNQKKGGVVFGTISATANVARFWNAPMKSGVLDPKTARGPYDDQALALCARYRATMISERRKALSQQLQRLWAERLPIVPIAYAYDHAAFTADLNGVDPGRSKSVWWNVERWYLQPSP